jgi:hypothetical protein
MLWFLAPVPREIALLCSLGLFVQLYKAFEHETKRLDHFDSLPLPRNTLHLSPPLSLHRIRITRITQVLWSEAPVTSGPFQGIFAVHLSIYHTSR